MTTTSEARVSRPWSRLVNPDLEEIENAKARLGLHPLIVADLLEGRQQPKFERFDPHLYMTIWDVNSGESGPTTNDSDLVLILTERELLLIQRGDEADLRDLDALLANDREEQVDSPIAATYRVLDAIVRDFVDLAAAVERELEDLEAEVFDSRVHEDYRKIYRLRRRIGQIDRAATGLAKVLRAARDDVRRALESHPELRPYFTHLENDARGVSELTSAEHSSLEALVSSHQSNVATRQNQDMRTISAFAALLGIPTVIAGIYGMNFKNLPPLQWEFGWLTVGIAMIVIDALAFYLFRRRGWLGSNSRDEE